MVEFTSSMEVSAKLAACRKAYNSGRTKSISFRKQQLRAMLKMLHDNEEEICAATKIDLGRDEKTTWMMEVMTVNNEIVDALDNIDEWTQDEYKPKGLLQLSATLYVRKEPLGVCLIASAYNYPFSLAVNPLIAAIAAGNCAMVKLSESATSVAKMMMSLLPKYLDNDCYPLVCLDPAGSASLLQDNKFDLIFFTGGSHVGRLVMKAAADKLTPCVLELGGKNPVFVDETCDIDLAAKRICFAKYANAGQICLAPDYVLLTSPALKRPFVAACRKWIAAFYGEEPQKCESYARLISARQAERLRDMLADCEVVCGGRVEVGDRYVEPTVVDGGDGTGTSPAMRDELFGPVLIVTAPEGGLDGCIRSALEREKPLAMYMFSKSRGAVREVMERVQSGGVTVNDCMMHYLPSSLPFGGVGTSGFGSYHGRYGFDAFTHRRAVYDDWTPELLLDMRYPPISARKMTMIRAMAMRSCRWMSPRVRNALLFALLAVVAFKLFDFDRVLDNLANMIA